MNLRTCVVFILILMSVLMSGCTFEEGLSDEEILRHADPIADNALRAINENNYNNFSADFDHTMKKALPEDMFYQINTNIHDRLGNYTHRGEGEVIHKENHIHVIYHPVFEKEPEDAVFRLIFKQEENQTRLVGIWLDSPKL